MRDYASEMANEVAMEWNGESAYENWEGENAFLRFLHRHPSLGNIARRTASAGLAATCQEARQAARFVCNRGQQAISQFEDSHEGEGEWLPESDHEAGDHEATLEAIMEHLGQSAATAKTEGESFAFLAPLASMALKRFAPGLTARVGQTLTRGIAGMARNLRGNPRSQPLVRALPGIVRNAASTLGRAASSGQMVSPRTAAQVLARTARGTLGNPASVMRAMQRSRSIDRRLHAPRRWRPAAPPAYGPGMYGPPYDDDPGLDPSTAGMDPGFDPGMAGDDPGFDPSMTGMDPAGDLGPMDGDDGMSGDFDQEFSYEGEGEAGGGCSCCARR